MQYRGAGMGKCSLQLVRIEQAHGLAQLAMLTIVGIDLGPLLNARRVAGNPAALAHAPVVGGSARRLGFEGHAHARRIKEIDYYPTAAPTHVDKLRQHGEIFSICSE